MLTAMALTSKWFKKREKEIKTVFVKLQREAWTGNTERE